MELEIVAGFLAEIVRFLSGAGFWCAVLRMVSASFGMTPTSYVVHSTPVITQPLRHVAVVGDETIVITFAVGFSRDRAFYREIGKVGSTEEPVRVRIPAAVRSTWTGHQLSEGLVVTGNDWWYATLDERDDAAATTFVKSDGSRKTYPRPQPADQSRSWHTIVIPGEKPRALELSYRDDDTIVREVDWNGATRSWQLPPVNYEWLSRVVAEPFPDGRIALLSNDKGLSMVLLADEGHFDAITLRNLRVQEFDAAIDGAGRIAVVAARNDPGTIEAAVIDPANPNHAEWRSLRRDVWVTRQFREVRVETTPGGFAAAWTNEVGGRRIEATDIDSRGHGGPIVEVGRPSPRGEAAFFDVQAKDDALLFWWDDGEHLIQRRLPTSLKGFALLADLARTFCQRRPDIAGAP